MKELKRRPLLIDEALGMGSKDIPKDWQKKILPIHARLREAKVFRFDDDAACYAARMIKDHPEAVANDIEFCIPPFTRMYIELPYPNFFAIMNPDAPSELTRDEEDLDVGYFYDGPTTYVLSRTSNKKASKYPMLLPVRYRMNREFTFQEEQEIIQQLQTSRLGLDSFFWGSCAVTLKDRNDIASLKTLRANHSCEFWYGDEMAEALPYILKSSAGDLRNIVALILFLNRTRDVQYVDDLPPAPGFVRAKPRTLVRHSLIRLRLDPGPMLQKIFKGQATGGWRREHDVRGHWCHDKTWRAHPHEHDLREVGVNQWKCVLCGGLKWWKREHHRGRKDVGLTKSSYEVHA